MVIRTLAQAGDPSLLAKNQTITSFKSRKIQQVIENLIDTMYDKGLIGIAAPQIKENYKIFVTHVRKTPSRNLEKEDTLRVFINPRILTKSNEKEIIYEGCGSVQESKIFGPVERPKEIEIKAFDENRNKFSLVCDGILARVILHEFDHLQNILFTEKLADKNQLLTTEEYVADIKDSQSQRAASRMGKIVYTRIS